MLILSISIYPFNLCLCKHYYNKNMNIEHKTVKQYLDILFEK